MSHLHSARGAFRGGFVRASTFSFVPLVPLVALVPLAALVSACGGGGGRRRGR